MGRRNLLIISYLFPPSTAMGAVRVARFASHLADQHGWSVHVVAPRVRTGAGSCRVDELSHDNRISLHETGTIDTLRPLRALQSLSRRLRGTEAGVSPAACAENRANRRRGLLARCSDLLAVPDTKSGWIVPAVLRAVQIARNCDPRPVILSSGPPHSAHVAASLVKRLTNSPWIADLRDPWSVNPYNPELAEFAQRANRALERRTLRRADAILCNTEPACRAMQRRVSELPPERIVTIANGFDPEDFDTLVPQIVWPRTDRKVLLHAGSIYGKRDPGALLEALARLRADQPENCPHLVFLGAWTPEVRLRAEQIIDSGELRSCVTMVDPLSRSAAFAAQAAADGLILLGDAASEMLQVPGKLFEYLRLQKPVLSLFPAESPVQPYLERYAPQYESARPDDPAAILEALRRLCKAMGQPAAVPRRPVEELSRVHQVNCLHELLTDVCVQSPLPQAVPSSSIRPHGRLVKLPQEIKTS